MLGCVRAGDSLSMSFIFMLCATPLLSAQSTYYVDATSPPNGDCLSWNTACRDLQLALDLAVSGDQIWVASGSYRPSRLTSDADPRSATFQLVNGVAILGGFAGGESDLSQRNPAVNVARLTCDLNGDDGGSGSNAENCYHIITATDVDASTFVDGLTLTRANANGDCCTNDRGGGLLISNGSPRIAHCTFRDISALLGAGIYIASGSPTIEHCSFNSNDANAGGGVYIGVGASATIHHSSFTNNSAVLRGGAISAFSGNAVTIDSCSFVANTASIGGALFEDGSTMTVSDSRFERNAAPGTGDSGRGGAVYGGLEPGASYERCVFLANTAGTEGGAARIQGNQSFFHSVFLGNRADVRGGAVHLDGNDPVFSNCLFSGNVTELAGGAISMDSSTLFIVNCTISRNNALPIDDSGNCCVSHETAGCSDGVCEVAVCAIDRFCCDTAWDDECAMNAAAAIECDCGGDPGSAGGIHLVNDSRVTIGSSILWRNRDSDGLNESSQVEADLSSTVIVNYTNIQGWSGSLGGVDNIGEEPDFVNSRGPDNTAGTEDDNVRLEFGSPSINAGHPDGEPRAGTVDLDGHARVLCDRIDMGAYESGFGDGDCSEDIDLTDFSAWSACLTGPYGDPIAESCTPFDAESNQVIDMIDFSDFQNAFAPTDP